MSPNIADMLSPFRTPITDCYECGVEVPTLPCNRDKTTDIKVAGLFLKRILNDLRVIWNLLSLGYTSQAGSVSAAAFENCLIVNCIAGNVGRTNRFLKSTSGQSPWSVTELCRMYTKQLQKKSDAQDTSDWEVLYSQYMWLCKLKHPSLGSATHDALATGISENEYTIMAAPDDRTEDLPSKSFVLAVAVLRTEEAIESFADAKELDYEHTRVSNWRRRLDSIAGNLDQAVDPIIRRSNLPFDYKGVPRRRRFKERD